MSATQTLGVYGVPNIIVIGVPDKNALERVIDKLDSLEGVGFYGWYEPDMDLGFTAIATSPLTMEEKARLSQYRLWRPPICFCSSSAEQAALRHGQMDARTIPEAPIHAPVA